MGPKYYLGETNNMLYCYLAVLEETKSGTNFWLLGDNFLRAYYQVYDMQGRRIAIAPSSFITTGQYGFNNSVVYVPPVSS
jgi:Eukaryotic aspartyl protease